MQLLDVRRELLYSGSLIGNDQALEVYVLLLDNFCKLVHTFAIYVLTESGS